MNHRSSSRSKSNVSRNVVKRNMNAYRFQIRSSRRGVEVCRFNLSNIV
ncbi:unnamed protein product [Amoebophrya sp. A120]|nr:unnamed protein product [Amoebophrya sp. A120]|eukprot:GSA120T00003211001.1